MAKSCRGFYSWILLLPKCKFYQDQNQYALGRIQDNASLGKRSSEEHSKASKNFKKKLESLFDIAKPDIEFRLCEDDWKFVQNQRMKRKSTCGNTDTKLLARLERKKIREENHKRRQDQAKEKKEMLTMVLGGG